MDLPPSPFKHLHWFSRDDAPIFFGRGREIRDLYDAVTAPDGAPIVLLFGASGVGKSSLLAAGLGPRLEATHEVLYLRRDGTRGLAGTLAVAVGDGEGELWAGADHRRAWQTREERTGRPLVVVLDQAEEAWTHPIAGETEALVSALRALFAMRKTRPRGRLVLSFRKEWLAEVVRMVKSGRLPSTQVEVTELGQAGIEEAVSGPASSERLSQRYRLEVDPELPQLIVADLVAAPGSPIAPTLQVLLTKMWKVASEEHPGSPHLSVDLFRRLKRQGILLADFVDEQLESLAQWRPDLVGSGLALDVLAYHTTSLGTAEVRRADEIEARYGGRREVWKLIQQCIDRYLLAGTVRVRDGELLSEPEAGGAWGASAPGTTRLAHDTLAPIIRRCFEQSDLPGQRALRILAQRAGEWVGGFEGRSLEETDLTIVERGEQGMRDRTPDEECLLAASRSARARRARVRRNLRLATGVVGTVVVVLAVTATMLWRESDSERRRAENRTRLAVARELVVTDPTHAALVLAEIESPDRSSDIVQAMQEVLREAVAISILNGHAEPQTSAAFSPDGTLKARY